MQAIKQAMIAQMEGVGNAVVFFYFSLRGWFYPVMSRKVLLLQMENVGYRSLLIIVLAALSIGAMFGVQFADLLRLYRAESLLGAATTLALSKEVAPVLGAFIVVGRTGSSMAAEIANMRIHQELEAIKVMGLDPVAYLVSPRILASTLMMPLLFAVFVVVGSVTAYVVGVSFFGIDTGAFIDKISWFINPEDVMRGFFKSMVFGYILAAIGCYKGFYATKNARGVAMATTSAVVTSLMVILIVDFFITYFYLIV